MSQTEHVYGLDAGLNALAQKLCLLLVRQEARRSQERQEPGRSY